MNKQDAYKLLEEKMLEYPDYIDIPVNPNGEPMVAIQHSNNLKTAQTDISARTRSGAKVHVRQTVHRKLEQAAKLLAAKDANLHLEVVGGHRDLTLQKQLFEKYKAELSPKYSGEELVAATQRLVAVPEAAGHPAGAAVDIQIIKDNKPLDFGTLVYEFVPDTFTFSPFISKKAWDNRQLLRHIMMRVGFAPFNGEWWHFSYGDKEWAGYYGEPAAMYEQLDLETV
jgi:D-alanyl-D-alanine dipeptidase